PPGCAAAGGGSAAPRCLRSRWPLVPPPASPGICWGWARPRPAGGSWPTWPGARAPPAPDTASTRRSPRGRGRGPRRVPGARGGAWAAGRGAQERQRQGLPREVAAHGRRRIQDSEPRHAVSLLELSSFVGERLLRDTDAAAMAVGLEVRVPLLDHVLAETAAG